MVIHPLPLNHRWLGLLGLPLVEYRIHFVVRGSHTPLFPHSKPRNVHLLPIKLIPRLGRLRFRPNPLLDRFWCQCRPLEQRFNDPLESCMFGAMKKRLDILWCIIGQDHLDLFDVRIYSSTSTMGRCNGFITHSSAMRKPRPRSSVRCSCCTPEPTSDVNAPAESAPELRSTRSASSSRSASDNRSRGALSSAAM
jgi:hypothetical protein